MLINRKHKNILYSLAFIVVSTIGLSTFFGVAYIHTVCGLAVMITFGHLVTLDDDMPGEWSNPEGSKKLWHGSLLTLAVKFAVVVVLFVIIIAFPALSEFGA